MLLSEDLISSPVESCPFVFIQPHIIVKADFVLKVSLSTIPVIPSFGDISGNVILDYFRLILVLHQILHPTFFQLDLTWRLRPLRF